MEVIELPTICKFCGYDQYDDIAPYEKGFWCGGCDGFTYFNPEDEDRKFTLILESKGTKDNCRFPIDIRLNKRLSPLRYPGGKSRIADYIYTLLNKAKTETLYSPFAGGAGAELALLHSGVIKKLVLNDKDYGVYALFEVIKTDPDALIKKIRSEELTHEDYYRDQERIKQSYRDTDLLEAAWITLVVNRLAYSGIYYANPLGGKNGMQKELLGRWNPEALINRIRIIHSMSDRITVMNTDACELIEEAYWHTSSTILVDPPYYLKGKKIYRCYYNEDDHLELNFLLESLYRGFPGADLIVCYDDVEFINNLYFFPEVKRIGRAFSI